VRRRQRIVGGGLRTHHQTFGNHATWNAEYGYAAGSATLLTAGFGTAFRAPDSTDRYGFAGNPALKPESARNVELGLRQRLARHQTVTLSAFENRIDDLIQYVAMPTVDNPYNGVNENVDRARIRGAEAAWDYADPDWQAHLAASGPGTVLLECLAQREGFYAGRGFSRAAEVVDVHAETSYLMRLDLPR